MLWATIYFGGKIWLWPAASILAVALAVLFWSYLRSPASGGLRAICLALKILGLTALAACLLEPLWSGQRAKPGANLFVVLADNSQSMELEKGGPRQTHADRLKATLLSTPGDWQTKLEEQFQLRRYLFDSRLHHATDFSALDFSGRLSALNTTLRAVARRFEGRPLAGVLLFTDGNATDLQDGLLDATGLPPIYPVVTGGAEGASDLSVQDVAVTQTSFEDAPVTLQAQIKASGFTNPQVVAELFDLGHGTKGSPEETHSTNAPAPVRPPTTASQPLESQTARLVDDAEPISFRFQFRPKRSGVGFYRLRISARNPSVLGADAPEPVEATLVNNERILVVDRGRGPYRVLYVGGRPSWEFKFFNRALLEDDQIQVVGLIRVARREPKFEFKGRQGESSNPLFRGFDQKNEQTEQYDQPVLIRLNTHDEQELVGGFPKTEEELYGYHAVILDDVEAEFFTRDQLSLLLRYVSERGAGLLMLGGPDSFKSGKYERTPVANLLPVYLDAQEMTEAPDQLALALTREGWLQPWVRLRSNEIEERTRAEAMPGFHSLNRVEHIKPGAVLLAQVTDRSNHTYPALAAQRFGHGRTAALLVGDFWRWGMKDAAMQRDLGKAWRQMIRWLIADVPAQTALTIEPIPGDPNQSVQIQVRVRDKQFRLVDNATVNLVVTPVASAPKTLGKTAPGSSGPQAALSTQAPSAVASTQNTDGIRLTAQATTAEAGVYEATFVPRETGGYLVQAEALDDKGATIGLAEGGWTSDAVADEFRSLAPNRALLETLARNTGGQVIEESALEKFVTNLPDRKAPIQETYTLPFWHQATVFLFALLCFAAEWGLRRWKGLA